jgi:hypothetical protein
MQILSVQDSKKRSFRIAVDIGQYHFITADGYREEWITETPREWWKKQEWLKAGGWKQDESKDRNSNARNGRTRS